MPMPLRSFMVVLWDACVAGAAVILLLALDWVSATAFVVSGLIGLVVDVPDGIWNAKRIKRKDAPWPSERRKSRSTG
ncbi:hypothetical protein I5535_12200 [Rhodobacteraceae bacterium F11138]|nr:hypothetical protein [Rhodobacteraceae bacterium F11138]